MPLGIWIILGMSIIILVLGMVGFFFEKAGFGTFSEETAEIFDITLQLSDFTSYTITLHLMFFRDGIAQKHILKINDDTCKFKIGDKIPILYSPKFNTIRQKYVKLTKQGLIILVFAVMLSSITMFVFLESKLMDFIMDIAFLLAPAATIIPIICYKRKISKSKTGVIGIGKVSMVYYQKSKQRYIVVAEYFVENKQYFTLPLRLQKKQNPDFDLRVGDTVEIEYSVNNKYSTIVDRTLNK